jgi:hypothetical protein
MAVRCPLAAHVNDIQTDVKKDDLKILDETMGSEMGVKTEDLEEGPEEVEVVTTCEKQINVNYQFELNGIEPLLEERRPLRVPVPARHLRRLPGISE